MDNDAKEIISSRAKLVDSYIKSFLINYESQTPGLGRLYESMKYSLSNGGKRFRPVLSILTAELLGYPAEKVLAYGAAVEFIHTYSLIHDDLPCMDNDDYRREKPSTHKVFGETVALLASYAMITEGFEMIHRSAQGFPGEVGMLALASATKGSGLQGATGGQFYDLFPKGKALDDIREIIEMKTVTLFEVAFAFGWLFGGGDIRLLEEVKKAAYHFGMAFQIADDLDDLEQDNWNDETPNLALCLGQEQALFLLEGELNAFQSKMKKLQIMNPEFQQLLNLLKREQALPV